MATIRKRNGKYQVQVRINSYTSSKTFPCYELAKKWANKQEIIAFTEPDDRPRYQPTNFKEILLKYWEFAQHHHKGASVEQIVIQALCREHWVNKPLPGVCRADIIEFRDRRLLTVKPDTFKRQMNIIRSATRMASEEWAGKVRWNFFKISDYQNKMSGKYDALHRKLKSACWLALKAAETFL